MTIGSSTLNIRHSSCCLSRLAKSTSDKEKGHRDIQEGLDRLNRHLEKRDDKEGLQERSAKAETSNSYRTINCIGQVLANTHSAVLIQEELDYPMKEEVLSYKRKDVFILYVFKLLLAPNGLSQSKKYEHLKNIRNWEFHKGGWAHMDSNKYFLGAWGALEHTNMPLLPERKHLTWTSHGFEQSLV